MLLKLLSMLIDEPGLDLPVEVVHYEDITVIYVWGLSHT